MDSVALPIYALGPFTINTADFSVRFQGKKLPIHPKGFDFLVVLLKNRGRVVTKDELMLELWPRVIVGESNLSQQATRLRRLLWSKDPEGMHIETASGRGYMIGAESESKPAPYVPVAREQDIIPITAGGLVNASLLLSDAPFRLFVWVVLNADKTGQLKATQKDLARILRKSKGAIGRAASELQTKGVCQVRGGSNQHDQTRFKICPAYTLAKPFAESIAPEDGAEPRKV